MRRPTGPLGNLAVAAFRTTTVFAVVGGLFGLGYLVAEFVHPAVAIAAVAFMGVMCMAWPDDRDGWWYTVGDE